MPTPSGWATSKMTMVTFNFVNKVNIHLVTLKLGLDDFIHIFNWYLNINKIILIQMLHNDSLNKGVRIFVATAVLTTLFVFMLGQKLLTWVWDFNKTKNYESLMYVWVLPIKEGNRTVTIRKHPDLKVRNKCICDWIVN